MWLLSRHRPPNRKCTLSHGFYLLPNYYKAREAELLGELLCACTDGMDWVVVLSWEAFRLWKSTWEGRSPANLPRTVVVLRGVPPQEIDVCREQFGRCGAGWVLAQVPSARPSEWAWLERTLKSAVTDWIRRDISKGHPLENLNIGLLPLREAGELAADPLELVGMLEQCIALRLNSGLGEDRLRAPDWLETLHRVAGQQLAVRMRGIRKRDRANAARMLLRHAGVEVEGETTGDPLQQLADCGLAEVLDRDVVLGPLARAVSNPSVRSAFLERLRVNVQVRTLEVGEGRSRFLAPPEPTPIVLPLLSSLPLLRQTAAAAKDPLLDRGVQALEQVATIPLSSSLPAELHSRVVSLVRALASARSGGSDGPLAAMEVLLRAASARGARTSAQVRDAWQRAQALSGELGELVRADMVALDGQLQPPQTPGNFVTGRPSTLTEVNDEAVPSDANALGNLAVRFARNGNVARAESMFERAILIEPNHAINLGNFALFLRKERRDLDRAEQMFQRAIDADPNRANNLGKFANFLRDERRDFDHAERMYQRAIDVDPNHANNLGNFANFLRDERRDLDRAEQMYQRAVDADPNHANNLGGFALFLWQERRDLDRAEQMFQRAIDADPKNASNLANFARFLRQERRDLDRAEQMFQRAIDADPKHAINLCNFALFLWQERRDLDRAEQMFQRAIDADPKNAINLGAFALFLWQERRDLDRAEQMFQRAIDADPNHAINLGAFANFLRDERRDLDRAEQMFQRAIDADPNHAINLGAFALFLWQERRDLDRAEQMFQRAIDADRKNATDLANFARFLRQERRDLDRAEQMFQRAIDADPKHAINLGNFALFLWQERRDLDRAEQMFQRAIDAAPKNAINLANFALLLGQERRDLDRAEQMFQRAIDADPNNANSLGAFALFLWQERRDLDRAEQMFQRAIDADPNHAINLGNFALYLRQERRDLERAEQMFQRAIDADPNHAINLGNFALYLRQERRDLERAEQMFQRAIDADPNNAINLGNFALYLRQERRDLERAEQMFQRAIDADPNNANNLGNFAQFLFALGRPEEGAARLAEARNLEPDRPDLKAELAFYEYAHLPDQRDHALSELLQLIHDGVRSPGWDLQPNIERAILDGHPNPHLLQALADVLTKNADPAVLEQLATDKPGG